MINMIYTYDTQKDSTKVKFIEDDRTYFTETNGESTLHICAKDINRRKFIKLCRKVVQEAKKNKIKKLEFSITDLMFDFEDKSDLVSLAVQSFEMANFDYNRFKTKRKSQLEEIIITGDVLKDEVEKGQLIGEMVNEARTLNNTPGGEMTPYLLASEAERLAENTDVTVNILGYKEMEKLKMGAILGVAQGSKLEPKLIVMEYKGAGDEKPIVLVGKGITYDTGGLNIKTGDGMLGMHMDMSGGGAVITTVILASKLNLKKNVIAIVPAVENAVGGDSYRPGDILVSMSGQTIEVLNTDAEGRLILADGLTYAEKFDPKCVIDVATLTGAALVALGQHTSAVISSDNELSKKLQDIGESAGDYVWPLPLWDEYEERVKGNFADLANIPANGNTRYGGTINAGMFLYQFAKKYKWAHIDMAPRMEPAPGDNLSKGSTGAPIQLLIKFIEEY